MPTLSSLLPWMLLAFTSCAQSSRVSSGMASQLTPCKGIGTPSSWTAPSIRIALAQQDGCAAAMEAARCMHAGVHGHAWGSRRYTCAEERSSTWNLHAAGILNHSDV